MASSSGALPPPDITRLQAFEEQVLRLPYMQEGRWKMQFPAEVEHDWYADHSEATYARQRKARDKSIDEWDNILSMQELPAEARQYLDDSSREHGGFLENPYYYPEDPSEQKPMYAYPGKHTLLGRAPEFPVRGRNGELITMLPNRFIDPTNVVELMEYAAPIIDYELQPLDGSIWNTSSWGIPGHHDGADLRPEDYVEISKSDQGRALLGESMGPDCWLGSRTGTTHEPSDSEKYDEKQGHLLRLFQKRLDLTHVPGAESAGILGAKALLKLGLGTINPLVIVMVMQNTPVAHHFQLQFQSNCVMRGSKRLQTIFIWVFLYAFYHHSHYDETLIRGDKDWKVQPAPASPMEMEGRLWFWNYVSFLVGLHGQSSAKHKYLDDDATVFTRAIGLAGREIYPRVPTPPTPEECSEICDSGPAWLFPQTQLQAVLMGCHRFREKVVSELHDPARRALCPLPGDIRNGVSLQIAFKMQPRPVEAPPLVKWENGHASRQTSRGFDQVEVIGPVAHQKWIVEYEDWEAHLPSYATFRDSTTEQKPNECARVLEPYVLGRGMVVWKQREINDWTDFQHKKNTPCTATPRHRPQIRVTREMRAEYSTRIPIRGCHPDTPAEIPAPIPPPVTAAKGKSKGKRGKAPVAQATPPGYQWTQPSSWGQWRSYPSETDPQAWRSSSSSWQS